MERSYRITPDLPSNLELRCFLPTLIADGMCTNENTKWSPAAILPKRHRSISLETQEEISGRSPYADKQAPGNTWLENTCRSTKRLYEIYSTTHCCNDRLNPPWQNKTAARLAIFTWIESWYNLTRRHSGLGYLSPNNFEKKHNENNQTAINPFFTE